MQYTESWAFDNNGNRSSRIGNTSLTTSYQTTTGNRLAKTTTTEAKNFTYDSLGNLTKKTGHGGTVDYTYDGFNRLKTVKSGSVMTTYDYDVFNLRSRKSSSAGSVNYIYAPDGRLTAETNSAGGLHTVYIWLDGEIIGLVRGNKLYTTHNDHLGRPEVITDSTKKVVWKSQNTSYDSNVIQSSIGAFNIGFPGQYYDVESNLWYNWNRYYDASIGRYTQSDPIGLAGGLNTYAYVGNNPVGAVDWMGLEQIRVMVNNNGALGTHAGLILNNKKTQTIWDPNGSFHYPKYAEGSGRVFEADTFFTKKDMLSKFMKFQFDDGNEVYLFDFEISEEDYKSIMNRIENGCGGAFSCATCTSSAISGIGPFKNVPEGIRLSINLQKQMLK